MSRDRYFRSESADGVVRFARVSTAPDGGISVARWRAEQLAPSMFAWSGFSTDTLIASGYVEIAEPPARVVPRRPEKLKEGALVPLPGVDMSKLRAAVKKNAEAVEVLPSHLPNGLRAACATQLEDRSVVFWHLFRNGHLDSGLKYPVLALAAEFADEATPDEIIDLLVKLPTLTVLTGHDQPYGGVRKMQMTPFLPECDERHEELLWSAWRRGPEVVRARENELSADLQRALLCVRHRAGDALTPEQRAAVAQGFAAVGRPAESPLTLRVATAVAPPSMTRTTVSSGAKLAANEVATSTVGEALALFASS